MQDLRRRTDIIIKPADKGGVVVVWSRDLNNQEAHRQLSDNRFYLHLDADPTRDDQKTVKDTIRAMIATCELPPTGQHLVVSTPRTSRFYRGSPIGFSGSGIWLISRSGFGILKEKGDEIRDCNYDRDTGFGNF